MRPRVHVPLFLRTVLAMAMATAASACGSEEPVQGTEGTSSTGEATSEATTGSTTTGDTTTAGATTDDTQGGQGLPPVYEQARGIRLSDVTVNQGVQVEVVRDGIELDPAEYNTRLISGRYTALRARWVLHADFEPRPLIGRLTLQRPDGTYYWDDFEVMVDSESNDAALDRTFSWLLPPEEVVPGVKYRIEAFEPDAALATGEVSDPPPVLPLPGLGTLSLEEQPMELKVVLVPILHQIDGCEQAPVITDEDVTAMREELEQLNPVQTGIVTVRDEPMVFDKSIGMLPDAFSQVLSSLAQTREADAPADNVYYYGLMESCDGYPPGLLGQAIGIPGDPTPENAHQRVSTGRYWGSGADAAETFVHEVGHTQGRYHIVCSGGEGGPDLSYPHSNGRIGVWGFGIHDHALRSPTKSRDYMSYCANEFMSDFSWRLTFDIISELTSWDYEDTAAAPKGVVLVGALYSDGTTEWWTARGGVSPRDRTPGVSVELRGPDGTISLPAHYGKRPHSETYNVFVELPADVAATLDAPGAYDELRVRHGAATIASAETAAVNVLHRR